MTTSQERALAVDQTRAFLFKLLKEPSLPFDLRHQVRMLLRHYPKTVEMDEVAAKVPHLFQQSKKIIHR